MLRFESIGYYSNMTLDVRVDDSRYPLQELKRLIRIHTAHQHANEGDHYLEINQVEKALVEYGLASKLYLENPELPYWFAVTMVGLGNIDKALPIFSKVFKEEPRLKLMTLRIMDAGLLPKEEYILKLIMKAN